MQRSIVEHTNIEPWSSLGTAAEDQTPLLSANVLRLRLHFIFSHWNWAKEDLEKCFLVWGDFCCNNQMVEWQFDVNNIKTWIHPAARQQTGSWSMKTSSLNSNDLHCHQILIQSLGCGETRDWHHQICSNFVMLSHKYGTNCTLEQCT